MTAKLLLVKSENGLETRQDYDGLPTDNPTFTGGLTGPYITLTTDQDNFPTAVGSLFWNETEQTYNIVRADGSTLSIGQENTFPMKNEAGGDLLDGQLVRISGATGANPTVALADASSHANASTIGMVTQPIANHATGNVATSISIVNTLDTSAYPAGTELFLSLSPGEWSAAPPAKPNHRVSIGFVIRQHAVNGAILLWINCHESLGELNDVDTTGAAVGNGLALYSDGVWKPKDFLERQAIIDARQLSGFVDKGEIVQSYNSATRVVTITHPSGTIRMRFQGKDVSVPSPWVTPAHADTPGATFYYYSTDGETFAWSTVPFQFEWIQVVAVRYGTSMKFAIRECHGLMDPEAHRSQHRTIWTYVQSGGTLTGGTYSIGGTASDANNTPGIDAAVLRDEDLPTSIDALPQGSYKVLRPSSGEFAVDTLSFPFTVTPAGYINYYATDAATQGATGKFYNVYVVGIPTTSPSDPYRWVFIAPQAQYDSLDAASAESFDGLQLGDLVTGTSEYAPRYRLIYGSNASYATTGKVRLDAVQVLERSPLRSTSTSVATLSGTGSAGLPAVWAGPTSLTFQDAATFRNTIGALSAANPTFTGALSGPTAAFTSLSATGNPDFGSAAAGSAINLNSQTGTVAGINLKDDGVTRATLQLYTGSVFRIIARDVAGVEIDNPFYMSVESGGEILLGGASNRPLRHTGVARIVGALTNDALSGTGTRPVVASSTGVFAAQDAATFRTTIGALATSLKGAVNGVAELGADGRVPSGQLPSYVDDVLEYADFAALPATGETGKIYITQDDNKTWRWSGSAYVEISASLVLGETSATAYRGDRGKTAYDHSQVVTGNPHGVTAAEVGALSAITLTGAIDSRSINGGAPGLYRLNGSSYIEFPASLSPTSGGTLLQTLQSNGRVLQELFGPATGKQFQVQTGAATWSGWTRSWDNDILPVSTTGYNVVTAASQAAARTAISAAKAPSRLDVSASANLGDLDASAIKVTATDVNLTLSGGTDGQWWDIVNPTVSTGIVVPSGATLWKSIGYDVGPVTISLGGGKPIRITRFDDSTWIMLGSQ